MTKTSNDHDLLITCVQDLYAGCAAFAEKYPPVTQHAQDDLLRDELTRLVACASQRAGRLEVIEEAEGGPENLWMSGILDDANRDIQTIAQGRHLDIALIGGVRKALVAELVSHETAMVLAKKLEQDSILRALQENRTQLSHLDATLAGLLESTAQSEVSV